VNRSVVLVTADSLRADHCGFMGYDRDTTPTLDEMANDGMMFENAISPGPSTPESMPAILTGSYPAELDESFASQFVRRQTRLRHHMQARDTLIQQFKRRGYVTAGFSPNPYTSRYFGFDAGFDEYEDFVEGSRKRIYDGALGGLFDGTPLEALFPARVLLNWIQREEVFKPWEAFYDQIINWVQQNDESYFLWILLMDTHDPYLPPDDYRTQSRRATYHANWRLWRQGHEPPFSQQTHDRLVRAYDDTIRYADAFLARLQEDLPREPLIAVHGDHGEAFGEHGTYGHHQRLYEENIRVPLVIDGTESSTVDVPVSLQSIPDLLLTLAEGDKISFDRGPAYTRTLTGDRLALRGYDWKYMHEADREVVYDLASDPDESDPCDDGTVYEACQQLIDKRIETDAERRRIVAATEETGAKE